MIKKELEEIFTAEEIKAITKKVSKPKFQPTQEEFDIWCKFVRFHHNIFAPEYASKELFESMMELTTDASRVYDLWEDMIN